MSMEYIRKTYGVPAKRGARIEFTDTCGKVHEGRIVGSRGCYLRADMPTIRGGTVTLHPTSDVRYLPNPSLQGTGHLVDRTLQGVVEIPNLKK